MPKSLVETKYAKQLLSKVAGFDQPGGDARLKRIVHRVAEEVFAEKEQRVMAYVDESGFSQRPARKRP